MYTNPLSFIQALSASWFEVDGAAALRIDANYAEGSCALASHDKVNDLLSALAGICYEVDTQSE